jgi:hypothetical protein
MVYQVTAKGMTLPRHGEGNSEYDKDWSMLAPGNPIQLVLPTGVDWSASVFKFRVPDMNNDGSWSDQTLYGTGLMINWTLLTSDKTLQASGSQVMANEVNNSTISPIIFSAKK